MTTQAQREIAGFIDVPVGDLLDLSTEQTQYLIESFIMVKDPARHTLVPLIPNVMQQDIFATMGPREITVKWRRAGLTSAYVARGIIKVITSPGINFELFAHDDNTARAIFQEIVLTQYDNLPDRIKPVADTYNANTLRFHELGSKIQVRTVGQSERSAQTKGQARSIQFLVMTEFAFYAYPEDFFPKIVNCVPTNGTILIDSTPNGKNSFEKRFIAAMEGRNEYKGRFYPWWWGDTCALPLLKDEMIEPTDLEAALGVGNPYPSDVFGPNRLTPEQIKWRRNKLASLMPKGNLTAHDLFIAEFPEDPHSCFLSSGRPVFLHSYCKVKADHIEDPEPGHRYVIGHDASTGDASGHPCGTVVVDVTDGKEVWSKRDWVPVEIQAERLLEWQRHWGNAYLIVERNFPGDAVIALLRERSVSNFYYHRDRELREHMNKPAKRKPGFPMSNLTKPRVFTELEHALNHGDLVLSSPKIVNELGGFQYDDRDLIAFDSSLDTRGESGESSHGDLVVALALAWHARKRSGVFVA